MGDRRIGGLLIKRDWSNVGAEFMCHAYIVRSLQFWAELAMRLIDFSITGGENTACYYLMVMELIFLHWGTFCSQFLLFPQQGECILD